MRMIGFAAFLFQAFTFCIPVSSAQPVLESPQKPLILVTNYRGIEAPGLLLLALALNQNADVIVVAPKKDMDGSNSMVGSMGSMKWGRVSLSGIQHSYWIDSSPVVMVRGV